MPPYGNISAHRNQTVHLVVLVVVVVMMMTGFTNDFSELVAISIHPSIQFCIGRPTYVRVIRMYSSGEAIPVSAQAAHNP